MERNLLLVDDSDSFRNVTRLVLERHGYKVFEAVDGEDACRVIERIDRLACIVCDVHMPRMDGLAFLKHVKASKHRFSPVIMLTTSANGQQKQTSRELGASAWITKPFKPAQLVDALDKLCV
jgi:two-component system, chemotaxis family, chemotaxis protein CheY